MGRGIQRFMQEVHETHRRWRERMLAEARKLPAAPYQTPRERLIALGVIVPHPEDPHR